VFNIKLALFLNQILLGIQGFMDEKSVLKSDLFLLFRAVHFGERTIEGVTLILTYVWLRVLQSPEPG